MCNRNFTNLIVQLRTLNSTLSYVPIAVLDGCVVQHYSYMDKPGAPCTTYKYRKAVYVTNKPARCTLERGLGEPHSQQQQPEQCTKQFLFHM